MSRNRILIVDDEPAIREMVAVALELADFDVLEAENAQRGHEIIVDERPDLVLLDWMLPSITGIELARRLKRDETTNEIPIIMLTAKSEEDNKIQGLDVGADDEPVDMGPTEYRLLEFFMSHQERAYSRTQLLDQVWGANVYVEDRTIDVHIRRLRKALAPFGYDRFIQTVRGTGYRFSVKSAKAG